MNAPSIVAWLALLSTLAGACTAQTPPQPSDIPAIERKFEQAYEAKNWPDAIKYGLQLAEFNPEQGTSAYNLACVYALSGDKENALKRLEEAVQRGFADPDLFMADDDLKLVREAPQFKELAERVRRNADRRFESFKKRADNAKPLVIVPDGLDKSRPAPLIIALHGYGASGKDISGAWKSVAAQRGAILLCPQGVNAAADGFEWGNPREAEYIVLRALDQIARDYQIDPRRVVLSGFSQGGYMAFYLGAKYPQRFPGVIPVAGLYNQTVKLADAPPEKQARFVILVGEKDNVLPQCRRAAADFEKANLRCKLNVYEGVGHAFPKERDAELNKALDFLWND